MFETFIDWNPRGETLQIIKQANSIIDEYNAQGFVLTLRQLYYQFVARDIIKNKQSEYDRLGAIINKARLAGLTDWSAIEDRTRNLNTIPAWEDPESIVSAVAKQYQEDLWRTQPNRVEVWIEKDALLGVIEPVCKRNRVLYYACRGYNSQSEQYAAGKRFQEYIVDGQKVTVLHLGDHDPSGLDMSNDNRSRLTMFARMPVTVKRIALNMNQVTQYNPPPNPAKMTDSRADNYVAQYGPSSWELDALDPKVIDALITTEIAKLRDNTLWTHARTEELEHRDQLKAISQNFSAVTSFLEDLP